MTLRSLAALAAGIVFSFVASPALADLVTGVFAGTIYESFDWTDTFGAGTGEGTVNGQAVTGSFSYRLSEVPSNKCSTAGYGCYYYIIDGPDWLHVSTTFNGHTFALPLAVGVGQTIFSYDIDVAGYDYFGAQEESLQVIDGVTFDDLLSVLFFDFLTEHILDDIVPTSFSFTPDGNSDGAFGLLRLYHYDDKHVYTDALARWTMSSISARSIPEPASLALFAAGLAGLGLLARRRKA